jgi:hypothetical protein
MAKTDRGRGTGGPKTALATAPSRGSAVELDGVQFSVTVDSFHRVSREGPIGGRRKVVPVLAIDEHGSAVEIRQSEGHQKSLFRPGRSSAMK